MVKLRRIDPLPTDKLEEIGFVWHSDSDNTPYISDTLVEITQDEAEAYYEAVNELYDMYAKAAEYVIENDLFFELGIPFNLIDTIKKSWENDVHWHIYGRFDLAGGIDGKPIKLLEFNADTPTALYETALLQWAMLRHNNLDELKQFNNAYDAIRENFKRLITLYDDPQDFDKHYDGWKILFSSTHGNDEEESTTRLLQQMATDAGFATQFEYLQDVRFSEDGIFDANDNEFEYWFKLYPWEDIAINEGELAMTLNSIMQNQKAIILNPAYTLLFQSKGMLKVLCDLFPDSPYLLRSSYEPLKGVKCVKKPFFGREGSDVQILDENAKVLEARAGEYADQKMIYQEYTDLPRDESGSKYQAGVFFAYEACALGFRKGGEILDNMSKFVGHIIK
ncbi:MAG: glutathionylspermidine synthase family protein [Sulfuricurvum sp.]